jgi:hypothetical protein
MANCQSLIPLRVPLTRPNSTRRGDCHRAVDRRHHRLDQRVERPLLQRLAGSKLRRLLLSARLFLRAGHRLHPARCLSALSPACFASAIQLGGLMLSLGEQQRLGIARAPACARLFVPGRGPPLRSTSPPRPRSTACSSSGWREKARAMRCARRARRRRLKEKGRRLSAATAPSGSDLQSYFKLPSVRSADSLAMKVAPHQFDFTPVGSMVLGVPPKTPPGSLVKALHSSLLKSVSL